MKFKRLWLTGLAVLMALFAVIVIPTDAQAGYDYIEIVMDGNIIYTDVPPVMFEGRVFVPMRAIFEEAGVTVLWDQYHEKITLTNGVNEIIMYVGSYEAYLNGNPIYLDVPPVVVYGRTMVPIRFVGETLGYQVWWDHQENRVYLNQ